MSSKSQEYLKESFGTRLRVARERKRWERSDLSSASGWSESAIKAWENGIALPQATALVDLAAALDLTTDVLLTGREHAGKAMSQSHASSWDKFMRSDEWLREVAPSVEEIIATRRLSDTGKFPTVFDLLGWIWEQRRKSGGTAGLLLFGFGSWWADICLADPIHSAFALLIVGLNL